jgi:histidine triad (HIT) family protein
MDDCIFCGIIKKRIPAKIIYEDDWLMAFHDIHPQAPIHILLIPKQHIPSLLHVDESLHNVLLGHMMITLPKIACDLGLGQGFKTMISTGEKGGQEVFHLHIHLKGDSPN